MKLRITDIFGCRDKAIVRNDVILNNGYDVIKYFAKFEKFIPHSIIIPSFMVIGSQRPEFISSFHPIFWLRNNCDVTYINEILFLETI